MYDLDALRERLAQLIIQRVDCVYIGNKDYERKIKDYVSNNCGGFILFGGEKNKVRHFIKELQSLSKVPLFIASDIECGLARQIEDTTPFPCQMALASALYPDDHNLLIQMLSVISEECKYMGINMPLIPVLDVNKNPDNPIISTRAFSDDPQIVSWFAKYYADIFNKNNLIAVAKHFPGHGDTSVDSHISLPVINKTKGELINCDLLPFNNAIKYGLQGIMIGHLKVPSLDKDYPATLSNEIVNKLLRTDMGYQGLVLTDAMNMSALENFEDVYTKALQAGIDIILHPINFDECLNSLMSSFHKGLLREETINRAYEKVINIKQKGFFPIDTINLEKNREIAKSICKKSITLIKDNDNLIPIPNNSYYHLFVLDEGNKHNSAVFREFFRDSITMDNLDKARDKDLIIVIFTVISAWHGNSGISNESKTVIQSLIKLAHHSIVVSLGSPYVLRHFSDANVLISAYEPTLQAQENTVKGLFGEIEFNRNLPIKIS